MQSTWSWKGLVLMPFALGPLAAAIQGAPEARLLSGVCDPYGGYFRSSTGNGMVGSIRILPAGTGTYLDGLDNGFGITLVQQRMMNPWYYLVFHNDSGIARAGIQCRDEDGFVMMPDGLPIRISTDLNRDALLVYKSYGLIPEPYAHYVGGVKQDGVYLGVAGKTSWAFSNETKSDGTLAWKVRLLLARDGTSGGDSPRNGEIQGFLTAASG